MVLFFELEEITPCLCVARKDPADGKHAGIVRNWRTWPSLRARHGLSVCSFIQGRRAGERCDSLGPTRGPGGGAQLRAGHLTQCRREEAESGDPGEGRWGDGVMWELVGVLRKQEAKFPLTLERGRKVSGFEGRGRGGSGHLAERGACARDEQRPCRAPPEVSDHGGASVLLSFGDSEPLTLASLRPVSSTSAVAPNGSSRCFPPQRSPGGQASTAHRGEGHRGQISRTRPRHPDVPACPPRGSSPLPRVPDRAGVSRCIGGERQPRARLSLVALVVGATATLSLPPNR